jgi:hypothetical protein
MLKNRFRILKNPIRFHNLEDVQRIMHACCMLHNMILDWDRNLASMWEHNILWEKLHPFEVEPQTDSDSYNENYQPLTQDNDVGEVDLNCYDASIYANDDTERALNNDLVIQNAIKFHKSKTDVLINHFASAFEKGKVFWPTRFKLVQKTYFPVKTSKVVQQILQRMKMPISIPAAINTQRKRMTKDLEIKKSLLYRNDTRHSIGEGLFVKTLFKKGTKIATYIGEKVSKQAYLMKEAAGLGGYVVRIHKTQDVYLDCYNDALAGRCFASKENCPSNCYMQVNNTIISKLKSNAELGGIKVKDKGF